MSATHYTYVVTSMEGAITLTLSGEIDYAATLELASVLDEVLEGSGCDLLIDLGGVTLLDSEGIKMLLMLMDKLDNKGRSLEIVRRSKQVDRIIALAGVREQFDANLPTTEHNPSSHWWLS